MRLLIVPQGLLLNLHKVKLGDGISGLFLPGANKA
jgi:hypothetical protein